MKRLLLCLLLVAGCATPRKVEQDHDAPPAQLCVDVLFYNRDWFENAHEPLPDATWDWAKYGEVAERLARQRDIDFAATLPRALLLMQSYGATLFVNNQCKIDSPETVAALEMYRNLAMTGLATADGVELFKSQKIAMFVGRSDAIPEFAKITDFRWGVVVVPKGKVRWSRLEPSKVHMSTEPAVVRESLAFSHIENPWGLPGWDEFYRRAFVVLPEGIALGHLEPDEAAILMQGVGEELLTGK